MLIFPRKPLLAHEFHHRFHQHNTSSVAPSPTVLSNMLRLPCYLETI